MLRRVRFLPKRGRKLREIDRSGQSGAIAIQRSVAGSSNMKFQIQSILAVILGTSLLFSGGHSHAQLTGTTRSAFIKNTNDQCFTSQRADARNKPLSDNTLRNYCNCYSTYIADATTNKLIVEIESGQRPLSAITRTIPLAAQYCAKQVLQ